MGIINKILTSAKKMRDITLPAAVKPIINYVYGEYGEVLNIKIDSENKNLFLEVLLKGEKESIWLEIENYDLITEENRTYLKIGKAKASREWMNTLLNVAAEKNQYQFEIDSDAARILKMII